MSEKIMSQISQNESVEVLLVNFINILNCGTIDRDYDLSNTFFGTKRQNFS